MVGKNETNLWLAETLFDLGGVIFGDFTIGRSTVNSPVYINPRLLISNPEALRRVARLVDREVQTGMSRKNHPIEPFDLVAGVPFGGLHLATAYSLATNTPMIYVRQPGGSSAHIPNGHGIEGRFQAGQRVLLIDDLITTGGSVLETSQILEEAGLVVSRRSGREKLHFLNAVPIREVHDRWIDKYTERHVAALLDLKNELESER